MKKLIPLMVGMALTFGAVTMYATSSSAPQKATKTKSTKSGKKNTKKDS
jgi:hypothetical protein